MSTAVKRCVRGRGVAPIAIVLLACPSFAAETLVLAPEPRHQLVVFFAPEREPLTTLDLPVTADAGEVGTSNLYIPGDVALYETLEALGWSAIRRSVRWGEHGGYVVSFPCTCAKGTWWKPHAARELSRAASVDSVRYLERDLEGSFGFGYHPSPVETARPEVPGPLGGSVWVRVAIDTCGVVIEARVDKTTLPPAYGDTALAAARRWRFTPANCEPEWMRRPWRGGTFTQLIVPFRFEE